MTTTTTTDIRARVHDMIEYIKTGRILEAIDEFYAEDSAMQENGNAPTVGRAANIEREKEFLANVKDFKGFGTNAIGVDGDTALIESWMEFTARDGSDVRLARFHNASRHPIIHTCEHGGNGQFDQFPVVAAQNALSGPVGFGDAQ